MNTIGAVLKKIQDLLQLIFTGQGETNSRLKSVQDDLLNAKRQADLNQTDTDARLSALDDKLTAILATLQFPDEAPTALKITLEPGDTRNTGGF